MEVKETKKKKKKTSFCHLKTQQSPLADDDKDGDNRDDNDEKDNPEDMELDYDWMLFGTHTGIVF